MSSRSPAGAYRPSGVALRDEQPAKEKNKSEAKSASTKDRRVKRIELKSEFGVY